MLAALWSGLDLRFEDAAVEKEFAEGIGMDLVRSVRLITLVYAVCIACMLAGFLRAEYRNEQYLFSWALDDPRTFVFSGWVFMLALSASGSVAAHWSLRRRQGWADRERVVVCFFSTISVAMCAFTHRLIPVLMGHDPSEVWAVPSCSGGGGGWYLVMLHLFGPMASLPIRTHIISFHPALTVVLFTISAFFNDSQLTGITVMNVIKFMALRMQRELQFAKYATTSLLRMTCDSAIWISANGETVLESDQWLDHTMEKSMTGKRLVECFPAHSSAPGELAQLLGKMTNAEGGVPVSLLPVRLRTGRGVALEADLFVVNRWLGGLGSSTALSDAMGTLMGVRSRSESSAGLTELNEGPSPEVWPADCRRSALNEPLRHPTTDTDEAAKCPAPSCVDSSGGSTVALASETSGIRLPAEATVLVETTSQKAVSVPVSSLTTGAKVYCLVGSFSQPALAPVPISQAVATIPEELFHHVVVSRAGHGEHDILVPISNSILVQSSTRQLYRLAGQKLGPSELYEVVAADRQTIATGLSAVRYNVSSKQGETLAGAVSLPFGRRAVLGVLACMDRDVAKLDSETPFFVVTTGRGASKGPSEATSMAWASLSDVASQASSRMTRVTFAQSHLDGRLPGEGTAVLQL
eukprot:TRINITY_DN57789_c0_g1_i3.p1 TRINITY_DN57789_c0_g1~~TRINITY_DN57789_c0_g1_i3.p1  ORF type:complete len:638 (-),score=43.63 TRINITY_DN57789_c0_g1_i3:427-2340(-)